MKITQSWIKDVRDYFDGKECGHLIKYKWVDNNLTEPTKAMKLGSYVEQIITGALPKSGKAIVPEVKSSGKDKGEMYADWKKAYDHAHRAKEILEKIGVEWCKDKEGKLLVGKTYTKGRFAGTIDAICIATKDIRMADGTILKAGTKFILDLKFSGLLDDKWNLMGWFMTEDQKEYHAIQATQYHYIVELPFFYFVIGSGGTLETTTTEYKFFRFDVSEARIERHIVEGNELMEKFEYEKVVGFEARPEFNRCQDCVLKATCADRVDVPWAEIVEV